MAATLDTPTPTRRGAWSVDEALRLLEEINPETGRKWTNADLGRKYGVSKQAVGKRLNEATGGATRGGSQLRERKMPWTVARDHRIGYVCRCLEKVIKQQNGEELSFEDKATVRIFLERLARMGDMVVYYDQAEHRGFTFRERRPNDPPAPELCVTNP